MTAELAPAIEAIWQRSRPEIARRIASLEEAAAAMLGNDLSDELRQRAQSDAHKLAGSLGMFGFETGSDRAREVEQALNARDAAIGPDVGVLAASVRTLRVEFDVRSRRDPLPLHGQGLVAAPWAGRRRAPRRLAGDRERPAARRMR